MAVDGDLFCGRELIDSKSTTPREKVTLLEEIFSLAVLLAVLSETVLVVFFTNVVRDALVVGIDLQQSRPVCVPEAAGDQLP